MEISDSKELEKPKYGIAIHGTSSNRAIQIAEKGFDPSLGNDVMQRKLSFYYRLHSPHPHLITYLQSAWEKAMAATLRDREESIVSDPVLIVFEAPPMRTLFGKVIQGKPFSSVPTEGFFNKSVSPRIIEIKPLPDITFKEYEDPEAERRNYLEQLQQELITLF